MTEPVETAIAKLKVAALMLEAAARKNDRLTFEIAKMLDTEARKIMDKISIL